MTRLKLALFLVLCLAASVLSWHFFKDAIAIVYFCFAMLAVLIVMSHSPRPEWIGSERLDEAQEEWGRHKIGESCKRGQCRLPLKVSDLDAYAAVDRYYAAVVNSRSSEVLCKEVTDAFFSKAVGYTFAAMGMLFISYVQKGSHQVDVITTSVKVVTALAIFGVPALIDVAKLRFQAKLNDEASFRRKATNHQPEYAAPQ